MKEGKRERERGKERKNNRRKDLISKMIYITANLIYITLNLWKDYFPQSSSSTRE